MTTDVKKSLLRKGSKQHFVSTGIGTMKAETKKETKSSGVTAVDLDDVMLEKITHYMKDSKWKELKCPLCSEIQWTVPGVVYELRQHHRRNRDIKKTSIIPVVPVTCANCGCTTLINSIACGLTSREVGND